MLKIILIYNEIPDRMRVFMITRDKLSQDEYTQLKGVHHKYINVDDFNMEWLPEFVEDKLNSEGLLLYDSATVGECQVQILVGNQQVEVVCTGIML